MNNLLMWRCEFSPKKLPDKVEIQPNSYLSTFFIRNRSFFAQHSFLVWSITVNFNRHQIANPKGTYLKDKLLNIKNELNKLVVLADEIKRKSKVKLLIFLISSRSFKINNGNFLYGLSHSLINQNNFKMNLGFLIKRIRLSKGLKQSDIVEKTKLSKSYISEIEKGVKTPRLEQLELISKALEVPLSVLFFLAIDKKDVKTKNKERIIKELGVIMKNVTDLFELNIEEERKKVKNKLEVPNNVAVI